MRRFWALDVERKVEALLGDFAQLVLVPESNLQVLDSSLHLSLRADDVGCMMRDCGEDDGDSVLNEALQAAHHDVLEVGRDVMEVIDNERALRHHEAFEGYVAVGPRPCTLTRPRIGIKQ